MYSTTHSRRRFLQRSLGGATAIGIGGATPHLFTQAALAGSSAGERILVVLQMSGGNDGLNTVIPYANDDYRKARPKLAIATADVLKCNDHVGFHPAMGGLRDLLEQGLLSVVQGVGYQRPNRSHFEAMDIWHTCRRKGELREDGWLGRLLDSHSQDPGGDVPALHLGTEQQPFAVVSKRVRVPTIRDLAEFQLRGHDRQELRMFLSANLSQRASDTANSDPLLDFLQSSTSSALAASQRVTQAAQSYEASVPYPESALGRKMRTIAQLIDAGLTTSVYYVQHDGFDTHAQQGPSHEVLLRQWSEAVTAFMRDLQQHDHAQRVCVASFSEFGRRVAENASAGTDHGAAGPMFVCGGRVQPGIVGDHPSLTDLDDGDLNFQVDFRSVYATILKDWLGVEPEPILGGSYDTIPLFTESRPRSG